MSLKVTFKDYSHLEELLFLQHSAADVFCRAHLHEHVEANKFSFFLQNYLLFLLSVNSIIIAYFFFAAANQMLANPMVGVAVVGRRPDERSLQTHMNYDRFERRILSTEEP